MCAIVCLIRSGGQRAGIDELHHPTLPTTQQIAPGKAAMLTSSQTREEGTAVMQRVRQAPGSGLRLLYVTPEKVGVD